MDKGENMEKEVSGYPNNYGTKIPAPGPTNSKVKPADAVMPVTNPKVNKPVK